MNLLPDETKVQLLTNVGGASLWRLSITCKEYRALFNTLINELSIKWGIKQRTPMSLIDLCYLYYFCNPVRPPSVTLLPKWNVIEAMKNSCLTEPDYLLELSTKQTEYKIRQHLGLKCGCRGKWEDAKGVARCKQLLREGKYSEAAELYNNSFSLMCAFDLREINTFALKKGYYDFLKELNTPLRFDILAFAFKSGDINTIRHAIKYSRITDTELLGAFHFICKKQHFHLVPVFLELVNKIDSVVKQCCLVAIQYNSPEIYYALMGQAPSEKELTYAREIHMYHFFYFF